MDSPGLDADDRSESGSYAGSVNGHTVTSNSNVQVVVRVRPPNDKEKEQGYTKCVSVDSSETCLFLKEKAQSRPFTFDYVADEATSQETMFQRIGRPIAESCLQGYHCCLLAYGQTGAGKTFTMEGASSDYAETIQSSPGLSRFHSSSAIELRGLIPRVLDYIFTKTAQEKEMNAGTLDYTIKCSYLQIYNENVSDLLDPEQINLTIREDVKRGHYVDGLQEVVVPNAEACYGTLRRGSANRHVGMTAMNAESSRSHAVFTVVVESQRKGEKGMVTKRVSRFYLVDLAGSERQKHSEAMGVRLKEAGGINKSLSALGNVIKALVDTGEGKIRHVPYRDSKLTFLLKDALGGNSKCSLVANISPAEKNVEETLSTLKFAQRAKMMRNTATVNEDCFGNPAIMGEEIKRLRMEIAVLKANMGSATSVELSAAPAPMDEAEASQVARLTHIIQQSSKRNLSQERAHRKELDKLQLQLETEKSVNERLASALQAHKMVIKLREANIKRLEANRPRTEAEISQEVKAEMDSLRRQVDFHPDAVRFATDNHLLRAQVQELEAEKDEDEDVSARLEQTEALYKTVTVEMENSLVLANKLKAELVVSKQEQEASKEKLSSMEEQGKKQQELVDALTTEGVSKDKKLKVLEDEMSKLDQQYQYSKSVVELYKGHLEKDRHEMDVLEVQLVELKEQVKNTQKQADKFNNAYSEQTKISEELIGQLEVAGDEREAAKKALDEVTAKLGTVNELEAHVNTLEGEKGALEAKIETMGKERDETRRLLEVSQQAAADLKVALSDLQEQLNGINAQLLVAVQEKNESIRARSAAESQVLGLTSSHAELKKLHDSLEEQLNTINEQLLMSVQEKNESVRARAAAEGRLTDLSASEAEAKKQLETVTEQLAELSKEKESFEGERMKLQGDKEALEERLTQLAAEKAEGEAQLGAEVNALQSKVEALDLKADELEKRSSAQREQLQVLTAEKEAAESKAAELLSGLQQKEAALAEIQEQVAHLEGKLSELAKEKDVIGEQLAQECFKVEAAASQYKQATAELEVAQKEKTAADDKIALLKSEKQQLAEAHETIMTVKDALEESVKERDQTVQQKVAQVAKLQERVAAAEKHKEGLDAELNAALAEAASTASKLQAVDLELQKAQDGRLTAEGALEQATREVHAAKEEMDGLKQELDNAKSEAAKLLDWVNGLKDEATHLRASLSQEQDARGAAEQLSEERDGQVKACEETLRIKITELSAKREEADALMAQIESFQKEILELKTGLGKTEAETAVKDSEIAALNRQLSLIQSERNALSKQAEQAKNQAVQSESEILRIGEEKSGLEKHLQAALADIEELRLQIGELAGKKEGLEAAEAELLARIKTLEADFESARTDARKQLEALTDALKSEHANVVAELQEAIRSKMAELDALALKLAVLAENLKAAHDEKDSVIAEKSAELEALESALKAATAGKAEALSSLKRQEEESAKALAELEEQCATLEKKLEKQEREAADALAAAEERFKEKERKCAEALAVLREKERDSAEKVKDVRELMVKKERLMMLLEEEREHLGADLKATQKKLAEKASEAAATESCLMEARDRGATLVADLAAKQVQVETLQKESETKRTELEKLRADAVEKVHSVEAVRAEQDGQVKRLEQQVIRNCTAVTSARSVVAAIREEGMSSRCDSWLQTRIASFEKTRSALSAQFKELQTGEVEQRSAKQEQIEASFLESVGERTELEYSTLYAEGRLHSGYAAKAEEEGPVTKLEQKVKEATRSLTAATDAVAALEEEGVSSDSLRSLRTKIASLESTRSVLSAQLEEAKKVAQAEHGKTQLKSELHSPKTSLDHSREAEEEKIATPIADNLRRQLKLEQEVRSPPTSPLAGAVITTAIALDTPSPKAGKGREQLARAPEGAIYTLPADNLAASARLKKIVAARAASAGTATQRQPLGSLQPNSPDAKRGEAPVQKVRYSLRSRLKPEETSPPKDGLTTKRSRLT